MELKSKPRSRTTARVHFLVLFLMLASAFTLLIGAVVAYAAGVRTREAVEIALHDVPVDVTNGSVWLVVGAGSLFLLTLLIEVIVGLRVLLGQRGAVGFNALLQIALATVLLVAVNVFSAHHYLRLDWNWPDPVTKVGKFTLPASLRQELGKLEDDTTIVVYQRHRTFGQLSDKPDPEDYAAERKVVEKVQDLVEQFRELGRQQSGAAGPGFRVVVLDVEKKGFARMLEEETRDSPELRAAIDQAAENSIFFVAKGRDDKSTVQRLTFNEFYQLDKTGSREQGNLVLLDQGPRPFARCILNADEKKPRIAIGVIHDLLSTEGTGDYGLRGLKKTLQSYGFETEDLILKRSRGFQLLGAGAYTFAESRYDRLDNEIKVLGIQVRNLEGLIERNEAMRKDLKTLSLKELNEKYKKQLRGQQLDEEMRRDQLAKFDVILTGMKETLEEDRKERDGRISERDKLNVTDAAELQRMTDLEEKMKRILADCDMLILPRMTFRNLNIGDVINPTIYRLEDSQASAIKWFLKKGKPVLVCFGPSIEQARLRPDPEGGGPDGVEKLLNELGVQMGKTVVLYDVEAASFAGLGADQAQVLGANAEVPPVEFDWTRGDTWPVRKPDQELPPNPIRRSMVLAERSVGKRLDLPMRHPRPMYYEPGDGIPALAFAPETMVTSAAAWNEHQPFPTEERTPRFEEPKPDDPDTGKRDEKRHGRFSVGVAVERALPEAWFASGEPKPDQVRLVAYGHGGLFVGQQLNPAQEKLLLNSCNWLLGRDDRLPSDERKWAYPRVGLGEREMILWVSGTVLGLPALFLVLGLVVLMVRVMR